MRYLYLNFLMNFFTRQIHNTFKLYNQSYTLKKESVIKYCSSVTRKNNMEGKIFVFLKTWVTVTLGPFI